MKTWIKGVRNLRHKVLFKILLCIILFTACFSTALLIIYHYYNDFFRYEAEDHYTSALGSISSSVDSIFSELYLTTSQLPMDEYFQTLITTNRPLKTEERPALTQSMYSLRVFRSSKNYIDNAFLIDVEDGLIVSGGGTTSIDLFFEKTSRFSEYPMDHWLSRARSSCQVLSATDVTDSTKGRRTVIPVVQNQMGDYLSRKTFVITLSTDFFADLLRTQKITDNSVLMFSDGEGSIYAATQGVNSDYEAFHRRIVSEYPGEGIRLLTTTDHNGDEVIAITYGSNVLYNDFVYSAYIPLSDLFAKTDYIKQLTVFILVLLTVITIAIAVVLVLQLYHPIHKLTKLVRASTKSPGNGASMNELDFLDTEVNKLLDDSAQMKSEISLIQPLATEQYLFRILNELEISGDNTLGFLVQKSNFEGEYPAFLTAIVRLRRTDAFRTYFREESQGQLLASLMRGLKKTMEGESCATHPLPIDQEKIILIINMPEGYDAKRIHARLREFVDTFNYEPLYMLFIGVGTPSLGLQGMTRSYREAKDALASLSRHGAERIRLYADGQAQSEYLLSYDDETKLFNYLMGGMGAPAEALITSVVERNRANGISNHDLKELYNQLYLIGCRVIKYRALDIDDFLTLHKRNIMNNWGEAPTDDIAETLDAFLHGILASRSGERGKTDMNAVREYIEAHFADDISVESIARLFSLSPPYLTKVFKDAYGMPVKQFISTLRIERTKELLLTTTLSISIIAKRVGFNSRNTFLRMFTKMEGVTPTEYRSNMRAHVKN